MTTNASAGVMLGYTPLAMKRHCLERTHLEIVEARATSQDKDVLLSQASNSLAYLQDTQGKQCSTS